MSKILDPAKSFFEACETGKGWLEIHFPKDIELANDLFATPKDQPSKVW